MKVLLMTGVYCTVLPFPAVVMNTVVVSYTHYAVVSVFGLLSFSVIVVSTYTLVTLLTRLII